MYYYRNTRQLAAADFLGSLSDLHCPAATGAPPLQHQQHASAVADTVVGAEGEGEGYERASTGSTEQLADREVALRVLRALDAPAKVAKAAKKGKKGARASCAPPPLPPPPAAEEVEALTTEIARARHHAELAAMMCLHVRNAPELALEICASEHGGAGRAGTGDAGRLDMLLQAEQALLVREACERFGHGSGCRGELPMGTLQDCIG